MGKRPLCLGENDQCEVGNSKHQTRIPRCAEISQVPNPADGFYEWSRTARGKQPYCFEVNDGELFSFAGLWDHWRDTSGKTVET
jgi:SOS response associated peptidase (SRAP)